jgi:hypothetical protein
MRRWLHRVRWTYRYYRTADIPRGRIAAAWIALIRGDDA